jgi:ABC-2 type transport system permease protein
VTTAEIRRARRRGLGALSEREVLRVLRLWTQTIAPPVVAAVLFIVVFGVALGNRIPVIDGVSYEQFIVPGLVLMGVATSAFGNNSTSIFQARNDGFIEDPVSSPMTPGLLLAGYLAGGVVRSLLIGVLTLVAARVFVDYSVEHPWVLLASLLGTSLAFASLGSVVGLHSTGWDQQNVVGNLVIQPLVFLGGVFYSIADLEQPWAAMTHANPIFYMVVAARHGTLGTSEVSPALSVAVTLGLAAALTAWAWWTFRRWVGIRT